MAEINNLLQEAEVLYKNGSYSEAATKCSEIIKTDGDNKEAFLLWAKSYLFLIPITLAEDEKYTKTFYNAVLKAFSLSETFEEMFAVKADITTEINEWEKISYKKQVDFLVKNPTFSNWKTHIDTWVTASKMKILVGVYLVNSPVFIRLQAESGEEAKALRKKYDVEVKNGITAEEKSDLYFLAGCEIFENATALLEEFKDTSREALKEVSGKIIEMLTLSRLVAQEGAKKGVPGEFERLGKVAEILNYIINAQVFPNGGRVILFEKSDDDVEKLKNVYQRMKELDESFVIPEIVKPVPITPAETKSGGCYVATAVYGSYNCPQVWTLRRFRDNTLAETWYGRAFIRTYYAISPTFVKWFGDAEWFKNMWKPTLDKMVKNLNDNGVDNTAYNDKEW